MLKIKNCGSLSKVFFQLVKLYKRTRRRINPNTRVWIDSIRYIVCLGIPVKYGKPGEYVTELTPEERDAFFSLYPQSSYPLVRPPMFKVINPFRGMGDCSPEDDAQRTRFPVIIEKGIGGKRGRELRVSCTIITPDGHWYPVDEDAIDELLSRS